MRWRADQPATRSTMGAPAGRVALIDGMPGSAAAVPPGHGAGGRTRGGVCLTPITGVRLLAGAGGYDLASVRVRYPRPGVAAHLARLHPPRGRICSSGSRPSAVVILGSRSASACCPSALVGAADLRPHAALRRGCSPGSSGPGSRCCSAARIPAWPAGRARRVPVAAGAPPADPHRSGPPGRSSATRWLRLPVSLVTLVATLVVWSVGLVLRHAAAVQRGAARPAGPSSGARCCAAAPTLAASAAAGLLLLLAAPPLTRGLAVADAAFARRLLAPPPTPRWPPGSPNSSVSRERVVDAAEAERRRIERDLHDGAQQRLVALAMELGRAKAKFADDVDAARELVDQAHAEAKAALTELRDLVRGVHPPVLTDRGLDAALSGLAARCPVPVDVPSWTCRCDRGQPSRRSPTSSSRRRSPTSPSTPGPATPPWSWRATGIQARSTS